MSQICDVPNLPVLATAGMTMRSGFLLLLTGTAAFEGIRAGSETLRMILDLPARDQIGAAAFADFSRATDLSQAGVIFYVLYGFGGLLLTCLSCFIAFRYRAPRPIQFLTFISAAASILILIFTTQAAPLMWAVGVSANNSTDLAGLLDRFTFWTDLRIVCADISFCAVLLALMSAALQVRNAQG
jgi:hypothetical protein